MSRSSSDELQRVHLAMTTTSHYCEFNPLDLPVSHPQVLDNNRATHVITGMTYGGDAVFTFERKRKENEQIQDVKGALSVAIKLIPGVSLEGDAKVRMKDEEEKRKESISVKFYGDYTPSKAITTYEEAKQELQNIVEFLNKAPVPKKIHLTPLGDIDSKADRIVRAISDDLVEDCAAKYSELHALSSELALLKTAAPCSWLACEKIPSLLHRVERLEKSMTGLKRHFQKKLNTLLPRIRGAGEDEKALIQLLNSCETSPLGLAQIRQEMKNFRNEHSQMATFFENVKSEYVPLTTQAQMNN